VDGAMDGAIQYGVKNGQISQTNPGIFYYFLEVKKSSRLRTVTTMSVSIKLRGTLPGLF
jgi:hypothetical protein